jgi:hypothetical protein
MCISAVATGRRVGVRSPARSRIPPVSNGYKGLFPLHMLNCVIGKNSLLLPSTAIYILWIIIIIIIVIIIYYLCAVSTATRPITDTAQCRYTNNKCNNTIIIIIMC